MQCTLYAKTNLECRPVQATETILVTCRLHFHVHILGAIRLVFFFIQLCYPFELTKSAIPSGCILCQDGWSLPKHHLKIIVESRACMPECRQSTRLWNYCWHHLCLLQSIAINKLFSVCKAWQPFSCAKAVNNMSFFCLFTVVQIIPQFRIIDVIFIVLATLIFKSIIKFSSWKCKAECFLPVSLSLRPRSLLTSQPAASAGCQDVSMSIKEL